MLLKWFRVIDHIWAVFNIVINIFLKTNGNLCADFDCPCNSNFMCSWKIYNVIELRLYRRLRRFTLDIDGLLHLSEFTIIVQTRRVPVQRAVEQGEIPYPYKGPRHDAASPIKYHYKIDHSRA